jgi:hypothetical protein
MYEMEGPHSALQPSVPIARLAGLPAAVRCRPDHQRQMTARKLRLPGPSCAPGLPPKPPGVAPEGPGFCPRIARGFPRTGLGVRW